LGYLRAGPSFEIVPVVSDDVTFNDQAGVDFMSDHSNLRVTEIKAFVPAKDFALSKRFYQDFGFTMASAGGGVAYFHFEHVSFLLQDFYVEAMAENFMMHMLVEDVDAWWQRISESGVAATYGTKMTQVELQPGKMRDFCVIDPSGVLWRIGQNCN
jgi:hypothetical protein